MSSMNLHQSEKYRRNRAKWIYLQAALIAVLTLLAFFALQGFLSQKRAEKIYCREEGNVDYTVILKENDFFWDTDVEGGKVYVGELVDKIDADFAYRLNIDDKRIDSEYHYRIDAVIQIKDRVSDTPMLERTYPLASGAYGRIENGELSIDRSVEIDYGKYNAVAEEFISRYSLTDTENTLCVKMSVDISEVAEYAEMTDTSAYELELLIPLTEKTVRPTAVVESSEPRELLRDSGKSGAMLILLSALALFDLLAVSLLVVFVLLSRDDRNEYHRSVQKIVSDYKNYIQKTRIRFNAKDRQILYIDSFEEMLEIRDTMQMPIIMYEDREKLCTSFFIIAANGIMYLFEIKSDSKAEGTYCCDSYEEKGETRVVHWQYDDDIDYGVGTVKRVIRSLKKKLRDILTY